MEIIQSPTVPRLQQNVWLDSTNNTLNAPTKDGWKSITSNGGTSGGGMTKVTHDELVSLRDEGKLTPGALYRITDYVATTAQEGTMSANHPFDIIVVALDEKTLSEDAGAIVHSEEDLVKYKSVTWTSWQMDPTGSYIIEVKHTAPFLMETNITLRDNTLLCAVFARDEDTWVIYNTQEPGPIVTNLWTGDVEKTEDGYVIIGSPEFDTTENYTIESGYFANSNLPAWQLKYCLDNDTDRFDWAVKGIPAIEGVPYSFMVIENDSSTILTRYPSYDVSGHYAFAIVNGSSNLPFDSPDLDYTNVDLREVLFYTEEEHPNTGDMLWIMNSMDSWYPIAEINGPTTEGQPRGKGVIYWMKDEHNNEAPFDFKGILLLLSQEWFENNSDWVEDNLFNMTPDNLWLYVFTYFDLRGLSEPPAEFQSFVVDGSVVGLNNTCSDNKIMLCPNYNDGAATSSEIPINIFFGVYLYEEEELIISYTQNNILNIECTQNIFGQDCVGNAFDRCYGSTVWSYSCYNKVGSGTRNLKLDGNSNIIMNSCSGTIRGYKNIIMSGSSVIFNASDAIIFPDTAGEIDFGQYATYQYPKFAGRGGMESSETIQFTLDQLSLNPSSQPS